MHGFFLGALCVGAVTWAMRHRRRGRCGSFGQFGWRGHHAAGFADWVAYRVDASPEQNRVIRTELEQLFDLFAELRREVRLSRSDIATALRNPSFDEEVMGQSFARQDDRIRQVRQALVGALARIHDVLDERQRGRLASTIGC